MIRWTESDPERLRPQEMALLALCDRMKTVEQLLTMALDTQRRMIAQEVAHRRAIEELEDRVLELETRLKDWE